MKNNSTGSSKNKQNNQFNTLDEKHTELLNQFNDEENNIIPILTKEREELKKTLKILDSPIEFTEATALKMEFSIGYINRVLAGTSKNDKIIYMALECAQNHKSDLEQISKKIQAL